MRAAAIQLLTDCAADAGIKMQIYPGRPKSVMPPTGFVDSLNETSPWLAGDVYQHNTAVVLVLVWGVFDSKEAIDQRDAFVDVFHEWVRTRVHQAGPATTIEKASVVDDPTYTPDWLPLNNRGERQVFYGTRVTMEGFATD